ncbi:hypothetical protein Tco_0322992 [Tanacetum coccineum]
MTKVIKGEFEKIKDVKVEGVQLTCGASLEVFNNEVRRLSRIDDDLFTYEVGVANIPLELTDEESSDDEDDIAEVFRIDTNIFDYETPLCSEFKEFNYLSRRINHEHNESEELCEVHEQPMCNIRRYMMIKYSFNDNEEYVAVKEEEYDDLTVTKKRHAELTKKSFRL